MMELDSIAVVLEPRTGTRPATAKPRLRGIPDVFAVIVALPAMATMIAMAQPGAPTLAASVYGISLVLLFLVSASYHTPRWPKRVLEWWRRVDHAMIYVMIAGGYTPVCMLILDPVPGAIYLTLIWGVTGAAVAATLLFKHIPRTIRTPAYVLLSWMIVPFAGQIAATLGTAYFAVFVASGILCTIGAVVYYTRWPNPKPTVFGYHEVFHVFIILGMAGISVGMWHIVTTAA